LTFFDTFAPIISNLATNVSHKQKYACSIGSFFLNYGKPPRSETPFTISSLAKTVPRTPVYFGLVNKSIYIAIRFSLVALLQKRSIHAEETEIFSSQTALTVAFPSEKPEIKAEISPLYRCFYCTKN
jgi:hypothetical protein